MENANNLMAPSHQEIDKTKGDQFITKKQFTISSAVYSVLLLSLLGLVFYVHTQEESRNRDTLNQLATTKSVMEKMAKTIDDNFAFAENNFKELWIARFEHNLDAGGLVTDDFYVSKATFDVQTDKFSGVIDLEAQPAMKVKYKGEGGFNISDRELKGKMEDISKVISQSYSSYFKTDPTMPKWESGQFEITVANYEVGSIANGVFKLKGE